MTDKPTLGKARGLNSIADPRQFKGSGAGRAKLAGRRNEEPPPPPPPPRADPAVDEAARVDSGSGAEPTGDADRATPVAEARTTTRTPNPPAPSPSTSPSPPPSTRDDSGAGARSELVTSPRQEGLSVAQPAADARSANSAGQASARRTEPAARTLPSPHRAVQPGVQRKRRELTVPTQVAEALAATGINAADVVMAGYRSHGDAIYAGAGGRTAARGRTRLRLSISDAEFDQITRLGLARGWNRSETVSVILAMHLGTQPAVEPGAAGS